MKILSSILLLSGSFCFAPFCLSEQQPSLELLEFLGEWQDDNGGSVNPFDYSNDLYFPQTTKQNNPKQQNDEEQALDE
jgi:hypothetical protein